MNYFGNNIRFLRKRKGLTQAKLAMVLGLGGTTISNYENGVSSPNLEDLLKMSKYFGVLLDDLLLKSIEHAYLITNNESTDLQGQKAVKSGVFYPVQEQATGMVAEGGVPYQTDANAGFYATMVNNLNTALEAAMQYIRQLEEELTVLRSKNK